ncbi:beta-glucuronidase [Paenibacillus sp. FSL H8-0259]|uniref:beta-glucuronidase n=1 Tax=Paenibacillus sp. FSL H8-0259 TaxID=1920423 RepID=UPI00096E5F70|nr:beta-glucuronidase [Paenibacillus sp. FSL H8-0259]OMF27258.1 beta-glucuronidase [Paenibacillus sp. FSL H8-0259]
MLYPIMTETRGLYDLAGVWNFKLDHGLGFEENWYASKLTDTIPMAVPSAYNDLGVNPQIRNHVGWVWYERELILPQTIMNERLVLRFGSATHKAKVFINGSFVMEHSGGFLPFEAVINEYIRTGSNRLTVAVNNVVDYTTLPVGLYTETEEPGGKTRLKNQPNFDFFNFAGLQRPVKIYSTPQTFVQDITVVTDYHGGNGIVRYSVDVSGEADIRVTVLDEEGNAVSSGNGSSGRLDIPGVTLWQPLNAYLYTLKIELLEAEQVLDVYGLPFGVRTVEVREGQFLINNQPFYFKGYGRHEDTPFHGRGLDEAANIMDFNLMKWTGANSFRTAHYPYAEEVMRLADREGFVVIDETPAVGLDLNFLVMLSGGTKKETWKEVQTFEHHQQVIRELINRDKNHACVVMWNVANEPASYEEGAYEYFKPLIEQMRDEDPQHRPVTLVTHIEASPLNDKISELIDVLAFNRYYGWYVDGGDLESAKGKLRLELEAWTKRCPGKPMMMTEYGTDTVAGLHDVEPIMFTEEYQVEFYRANHEIFDEFEDFVGEQVWNFADFATGQGIIRVQGNKKGIFTRERKPKAAAHELRKRWTAIPDFGYKPK